MFGGYQNWLVVSNIWIIFHNIWHVILPKCVARGAPRFVTLGLPGAITLVGSACDPTGFALHHPRATSHCNSICWQGGTSQFVVFIYIHFWTSLPTVRVALVLLSWFFLAITLVLGSTSCDHYNFSGCSVPNTEFWVDYALRWTGAHFSGLCRCAEHLGIYNWGELPFSTFFHWLNFVLNTTQILTLCGNYTFDSRSELPASDWPLLPTWMCSVLLILALTIVSYIVASDFVHQHPVFLESEHNEHTDQKKGAKAATSKGTFPLVFASERIANLVSRSDPADQGQAPAPSFERSSFHRFAVQNNGRTNGGTMEVPPLQEDLLGPARVLCAMRATLEVLYGPRFCAPSAKATATFSTMDREPMGSGRRLGNASMDPVTSKETVSKEKVKAPPTSSSSQQRQRSRQTIGRATKLWTTMVASIAIVGTPMFDSYDCSYGHQFFQCLSNAKLRRAWEKTRSETSNSNRL